MQTAKHLAGVDYLGRGRDAPSERTRPRLVTVSLSKPASSGGVHGGRGAVGDPGLGMPCSPATAAISINNAGKEWATVAVGSSVDVAARAGAVAKRPELGAGGEGDKVGVLK